MIKFFRQIRYNLMETGKTTRYFKYAIGEIILVVIGILIALQINNWNESQKNTAKEVQFLKNFKNDIQNNVLELQRVVEKTEEVSVYSDSILKLKRNEINELTIPSFSACIMTATGFTVYKTFEGTIQDIIGSGKLDIIKNDSIRLAIGSWQTDLILIREWEKINKESSTKYFDYLYEHLNLYKISRQRTEYPVNKEIRNQLMQDRLFLNYMSARKRLSQTLNRHYSNEIPKLYRLISHIDQELNR